MYAITAITGRVGGALALTLLDQGHAVRAIVRDDAKGRVWAERGCDVALAEANDADRLARAFKGMEGVFLLLPPLFDPEPGFPQTRAMIAAFRQALLHARPPKVVVLSTIGAGAEPPNLLNGLRFLEEALADVDLPISFLRAAWFMENAEWDIPSARENGVIHSYLQPLDRKVAMIATDDVGRTAAELLLEEWRGHRVIEIEAQERVSPNDVAAALAQALGRPVETEPTPRDQWEAIFRAQGMRNPLPRMQMLDGFNEGWIDFNGNNSDKRKGSIAICQAIDALVRKSAT